jgi:hypothetical protein
MTSIVGLASRYCVRSGKMMTALETPLRDMHTVQVNPGPEGYWDVDGEGRFVIAVTHLPRSIWAHARYSFLFAPPKPVEETVSVVGQSFSHYRITRCEPPSFLMLLPRANYHDIIEHLSDLNLKHFFEITTDTITWSPRGSHSWYENYTVHGAISMDETALMAFRMAISD